MRDRSLLALLDAMITSRATWPRRAWEPHARRCSLMEDLNLPRAGELTAEEIARARAQTGSDLDAAACAVAAHPVVALKKRMAQLGG